MRLITLILLILLVQSLTACVSFDRYLATPDYQSDKDPSFSYISIKEGGLVFAPTKMPTKSSYHDRDGLNPDRVSKWLAQRLRRYRKELPIADAADLRKQLSDEQIRFLWSSYGHGKGFRADMVKVPENQIPQRYIVFTELSDVVVKSGSRGCKTSQSELDYQEGKGDEISRHSEPRYSITKWASTTATLHMLVFDTKLQKFVWKGRDRTTENDSDTYYPPSCSDDVAKAAHYRTPGRPRLDGIVDSTFYKFIPHFPHKSDG